MQLIQENLEQDAYTFSHLIEQYCQYRFSDDPNADFDLDEVREELSRLVVKYDSWIGRDGEEWFGQKEINGASYRNVDEESALGSQPKEA
jgi:hypothetical protein